MVDPQLIPPLPSTAPVVVALSGGVDSATAAAMLVEAGHRVVGLTMRLYDARGTAASAGGRCCGPRDVEDARRVCAHLGIPFYVVDFSDEFRRLVIDDFVTAYLDGQTPNPCVRCNQHIKFSPLLARARALGADFLATGHYARIDRGAGGALRLRRGRDADKDQSYFLFSMPVRELEAVWFPLGHLDKQEVRARARRYGLPVADKEESHEICFVPDGDYAGFVERSALGRRPRQGTIVDTAGRALGQHDGIHRYTVGQRRGLGNLVAGQPRYVVRVDPARDQVVVGERAEVAARELWIRDLRWFGAPLATGATALLQVRHRSRPHPVELLSVAADLAVVRLAGDGAIAAPGQAAVFYRDDEVLGGGWIAPAAAA